MAQDAGICGLVTCHLRLVTVYLCVREGGGRESAIERERESARAPARASERSFIDNQEVTEERSR